MMRRGQLALEMSLLLGLLVFLSIVLFYFSVNQIAEANKISKAEDAVNHLAEKVDQIASLTPGTKDIVLIDIPSKVLDIRLSGRHISLILLLNNGEQYILTKSTFADLLGQVNFSTGIHQLRVTKVNDTAVKIGSEPLLLALTPQCLSEDDVLSLNPVVTLSGVDFTDTSQPIAEGTPLLFTFVNVATITMQSLDLLGSLGTEPKEIHLETPPDLQSNSYCFHIYDKFTPCSCESSGDMGDDEG